jgi:XTP/dITP diphosphohydrolase
VTARQFSGGRLIIASHNQGKVREIADLLRPFAIEIVSAAKLGLPEPEETETSFSGNARLKALAAARQANLPALSDDSGLEVAALDNAPGIYSARWAGPAKNFDSAMRRVLDGMKNATDRSARFVCALALAWPDGHCEIFEGVIKGTIAPEKRGDCGFGYDPIFLPDGATSTFGEMEPEAKHAISHRALAFRKLIDACFAIKN